MYQPTAGALAAYAAHRTSYSARPGGRPPAQLSKQTPAVSRAFRKSAYLRSGVPQLLAAQNAAAGNEIRRGKYSAPLHGIPWGAEPFRKQVVGYDATVVERLRNAGAVLVAKLSMGALAQGGLWFGGMTKTPWKTDQSSSGSSAGSAAATAAGLDLNYLLSTRGIDTKKSRVLVMRHTR
ncbi:MAG: amidase family protein [Bryobacterales bacterium]|nr:amidase family protein [Bryobacterales bacterium]